MRKTFARVIKSSEVNLKREYSKLYELFYGKDAQDGQSLADLISINFEGFFFRGTCLDLNDFDEQYGFCFVQQPTNFDIDYLVSFCEYFYNFVLNYDGIFPPINKNFYLSHIGRVIDAIN